MKVAPIVTDNGTRETGETLIIIDRAEGAIIQAALESYAAAHKRNRRAKKLSDEATGNIPIQ